jgi:hypothetical protein
VGHGLVKKWEEERERGEPADKHPEADTRPPRGNEADSAGTTFSEKLDRLDKLLAPTFPADSRSQGPAADATPVPNAPSPRLEDQLVNDDLLRGSTAFRDTQEDATVVRATFTPAPSPAAVAGCKGDKLRPAAQPFSHSCPLDPCAPFPGGR